MDDREDDRGDNGSAVDEVSDVIELDNLDDNDYNLDSANTADAASSSAVNTKYWRLQKAMKNDPAEKEHLLAIADHYKQSTTYGFHVKQWIGEKWTKPIISVLNQFALFKCMHAQCVFSTNSKEDMEMHMNHHLALIEVLSNENGSIDKAMRAEQIKFRDCSYCDFSGHSNKEILDHVLAEHEQCIFQCAYCFYRSIEVDNITLHYDAHHSKEERQIYLCGDVREFREQDREMLQEDVEKVQKIQCGQGKQFIVLRFIFKSSLIFIFLSLSYSVFYDLLMRLFSLFHSSLFYNDILFLFFFFIHRRLLGGVWYIWRSIPAH